MENFFFERKKSYGELINESIGVTASRALRAQTSPERQRKLSGDPPTLAFPPSGSPISYVHPLLHTDMPSPFDTPLAVSILGCN